MFASIDLLVIGRMKTKSVFMPVMQEYQKRMKAKINIVEMEGHSQKEELEKLKSKIVSDAVLVVLDEKGKSFSSIELAKKLDSFEHSKLQIIIGGADGLDDEIRQRADVVMCFGRQTWPHMMVRVMMMEQLYRAQQILANHPYHRE